MLRDTEALMDRGFGTVAVATAGCLVVSLIAVATVFVALAVVAVRVALWTFGV